MKTTKRTQETQEHKPGLLDAVERLAARHAEGGLPEHELESEKEHLLSIMGPPQEAGRYHMEKAYDWAESTGRLKRDLVRLAAVLIALGGGILLLQML